MGDTYHDPVDHLRTTRPLAGESLIDVVHWPGYVLVLAGVVGACGSLAAFASGVSAGSRTAGIPSTPKCSASRPTAERIAPVSATRTAAGRPARPDSRPDSRGYGGGVVGIRSGP
jgi:predicted anti-sigma-YlaC factor YlaD